MGGWKDLSDDCGRNGKQASRIITEKSVCGSQSFDGAWGSDFLRLYPNANVLVATKKDFEPANRKKFCSRIATGDYDAVIIGHTQFERIPLSPERQAATIERQIDEITMAIEEAAEQDGTYYTVKQMEKTRKNLLTKLERLNSQTKKMMWLRLNS